MPLLFFLLTLLINPASLTGTGDTKEDVIRIGLIGLDTSHSPAFTKIFNDANAEEDVAGFRVVAAYPYGSRDIPSSYERIPRYTEEVMAMGVQIVSTIDSLLNMVDVVLLETNDGKPHLEQALRVINAGKPLFIDKPVAASLDDAIAIFKAAEEADVPVFTSSSLRYVSSAQAVRNGAIGSVTGADTYSPATLEPSHPDLYWYGIHGVELLFTVMGPGCESVSRIFSQDTDIIIGTWEDGRKGVFRGMRSGKSGYGGTAYGEDGIQVLGPYEGYRPLVVRIAEFFRTGQSPVSIRESLEIYAFMSAADRSKELNGDIVYLQELLEQN